MQYVAIAAMAMQAVGAVRQGNEQAKAYEEQAQTNDYNANLEKQNAQVASQQGNANEEAQRRSARLILGRQRAAIAEAGIGTGGSAGDLYEQSVSNAEMDALNIRYGAQVQNNGFQNQAAVDNWKANVNRQNASTARMSGYLNAGTKLLSSYNSLQAK